MGAIDPMCPIDPIELIDGRCPIVLIDGIELKDGMCPIEPIELIDGRCPIVSIDGIELIDGMCPIEPIDGIVLIGTEYEALIVGSWIVWTIGLLKAKPCPSNPMLCPMIGAPHPSPPRLLFCCRGALCVREMQAKKP